MLPVDSDNFRYIATGIGLAISHNDSADCTAMVSARIDGDRNNLKIYILPFPVNEKLSFPDMVERAKILSLSFGKGNPTRLFIEMLNIKGLLLKNL